MSTVWKVVSAILVVVGVAFLGPPIYDAITNAQRPSGLPCPVFFAALCFFAARKVYIWSSLEPGDKRRVLMGFVGGFAGSVAGLILGVTAAMAFVLYEEQTH